MIMLTRTSIKLVCTLVAVVITLAACTNPTPTPNDGTTTVPTIDSNEQVILIWWNLFEPQENVQPLIDAYEAQHPNVTIQYDQRGVREGIDGYRDDLDVVLNDDNPLSTPDIFTINNSWAYSYEGYLSPAPSNVFSSSDLVDFYDPVKFDFTAEGKIIGIPLYMDAIAVIYNKQKLQEGLYTFPSDDWLGFANQARNLTKRDAQGKIVSAGFAAGASENVEFSAEMLSLLMLQNGVVMTNVANDQAIFANESELEKAQEALDFYKGFLKGQNTWDLNQKIDIASFLEKKLAMYAAPSWRLIDILNYNEQYNLGLDIGVAPLPQLGSLDSDEEIYWPSYWGQVVSSDSSNTAIAWDFIKFISEPEQIRLLDQTIKQNGRPIGIISPRLSMASDITDNADTNELLGPYVQALANSKNWKSPDGDISNEILKNVIDGDLELGAAQQQINDLYSNNGE